MKQTHRLLNLLALVGLATIGCNSTVPHNLPPSQMLMHPGPGVDGPGPGVMLSGGVGPVAPAGMQSPGLMESADCGPMGPMGPAATPKSQLAFVGPEGMSVQWDLTGQIPFDSEPLVCPGRQNFGQGAIYRLKLTSVPGRPGAELYPTLEVGPTTPRTDAYLAHNAIPIQFTDEDFNQVLSGNFVTKVIYLPDPEFQELALSGVETLVSTRLDPGVDPIVEADRRGAIMAIVRLGNKDLEVPGLEGEGEFGVVPAVFGMGGGMPGGMPGGPVGAPTSSFQPAAGPPHFVSGATGPQWGMPMSGTPIGLPGPPHVPLGGPAGLKRHVIKNHTHHFIPDPVNQFKVHVKQRPALSYPKPVNRMYINETVKSPQHPFRHPHWNRNELVNPGGQMYGPGANY